jgi:hypothetical protein
LKIDPPSAFKYDPLKFCYSRIKTYDFQYKAWIDLQRLFSLKVCHYYMPIHSEEHKKKAVNLLNGLTASEGWPAKPKPMAKAGLSRRSSLSARPPQWLVHPP